MALEFNVSFFIFACTHAHAHRHTPQFRPRVLTYVCVDAFVFVAPGTAGTEREMAERASFSVEAMVRGYHVYKDIWSAVVGTELPCKCKDANRIDPFAVAIVQGAIVVGHVPKKISSVCSLFLRRGGSIVCRVTGSRRYSEDLVQGGLEIPCVLRFEGDTKHSAKAKNLVESALAVTATDLLPKKLTYVPVDLPAVDSNEVPTPEPNKNKAEWVRLSSIELTKTDKECILA